MSKRRENFLKEHYLTDFHNQFMRLSGLGAKKERERLLKEWSYLPSSLDEDDDDMDQADPSAATAPAGPQGGAGAPDPNMGGEDPNAPTQGGAPSPAGGSQTPSGPEQGADTPIPSPAPEQPEDDVDEIEITDLTDAQEKMNKKLNSIADKVERDDNSINVDAIMSTIDQILSKIDSNNKKIDNLEREVQMRNPTPLEKLDLRSVETSTPYNLRPNDFWKGKMEELPNYDKFNEDDPNKTEREYVITTDDINDINPTDIENSFKDLDMDLNKIFGLR